MTINLLLIIDKFFKPLTLLFNSKIKIKLIMLFSLVLIFNSVGLILAYNYYFFPDNKKTSIEQNSKLLYQAGINLDSLAKQIGETSKILFYNDIFWIDSIADKQNNTIYMLNEQQRIYEILLQVCNNNEYIESVYLYLKRNETLYVMDEISMKGIPSNVRSKNSFVVNNPGFYDQDWYKSATENQGGLTVSNNDEVRYPDTNKNKTTTLNLSRALFNPIANNKLIAVISVNIRREIFSEIEKEICNSEEDLLIISSTGDTIYDNTEFQLSDEILNNVLSKDQKTNISGWFEISTNKNTLITYAKCEYMGWYLIKSIPYFVFLENARKYLIIYIIMSLLLCTVSIMAVVMISKRISTPINKLAMNIHNYNLNSINICFKDDHKDEIGILEKEFGLMIEKIKNLVKSEYIARLHEKEARIEALQAQINPHFLNNTLQLISSIAIDNNIAEIENINNAMSLILRYSINNSKGFVTIGKEIENVNNYMLIQQYRYNAALGYSVYLSKRIRDCIVPVLSLQPIIENSIKHGTEKLFGKTIIKIYGYIKDDKVRIVIKDNGTGIKKELVDGMNEKFQKEYKNSGKEWSGRGLMNINARIKYIFGEEYGILIRSKHGEWTKVFITIPLGQTVTE